MDREGDPLDKPVMEIWLVVVFRAKSCLEEILILISFRLGCVCKGMAVGRINRNTFYYHYQDMPALLEEICSIQVERIVADHPSISSFADCLDVIIKFALENKRAIMHIYYSDNRASYINALWRMCEQSVRTYVNTVFPDEDLSQRDRELIIRYHKCECFGLTIDWINNGMREGLLADMRRLYKLRKGATEEMIRRSKSGG